MLEVLHGFACLLDQISTPEDPNLKVFQQAVALSQSLSQWAQLIIGGTVVFLLGTAYQRPGFLKIRLTYLLMLPGWGFLGASIYNSIQVQRALYAYLLLSHPDIGPFREAINRDGYRQLWQMEWGVSFFVLWLVIYLGWWVFGKTPKIDIEV